MNGNDCKLKQNLNEQEFKHLFLLGIAQTHNFEQPITIHGSFLAG